MPREGSLIKELFVPEVVIKNDTCGESGLFPAGHSNAASKSRDNDEIFYKKTTLVIQFNLVETRSERLTRIQPRPGEQMYLKSGI